MRSRSPLSMQPYAQPQQQIKKYYTRDEVAQILRAMMESKLSKIYEQLQQKQLIIRNLNQKLNNNDTYIQNMTKKMYELSQQTSHRSEQELQNTVQLVNRMLTEKLQNYWHRVQMQLQKIRGECHQTISKYHQTLQERAGKMISDIRNKCEESVDNFKKKNNTYWIKIKQALNKMNARTVQSQEKIEIIGMQINKFQNQRQQNGKTIKELQNGQNTAKMLVQLKKSVNNVYKNFEQVMKLQQTVKQRYESMGSMGKFVCQKCNIANQRNNQAKPHWNFDYQSNSKSKADDIVILEYSMQQDTLSNHLIQGQNTMPMLPVQNKQRPPSRSVNSFVPRSTSPKRKSQQNLGQPFPLSPITGKVIQHSSMSNTIQLMTLDKNKYQYQNPNMSTKNETHEWGDHDQYLGAPTYTQFPNNQLQSNSFQLHNNSNFAIGLGSNSNANSRFLYTPSQGVSTSMLNFSLDCRKQMQESVRPRLVQMIETKGLLKPIRVFVDQINYLKNQEGNYIFDLKGNMFKVSPTQFTQLEKDKIVINVKAQDQQKRPKRSS